MHQVNALLVENLEKEKQEVFSFAQFEDALQNLELLFVDIE